MGWGWLSLLAPACMYWLLVYVSGIPPLEAHMLRSRGDVFRAYQVAHQRFLSTAAEELIRKVTMGAITLATKFVESAPIPDALIRAGIAALCGRTHRKLSGLGPSANRDFAISTAALPIAQHVDDANAQHYEVPAAFFDLVLGPQRKYSCCLFRSAVDDLAAAEEQALAETAAHAALADGQTILELGCGWGSLSLWMARHYPRSRIVAVSNSRSQRAFIEGRAQEAGLTNLTVVTADMNTFTPAGCFDRIVSVEMFEHMGNWRRLARAVRSWLTG